MRVPGYDWVCHKCAMVNAAGLDACSHCGFPAVASAIEIARANGEPDPVRAGYRAFFKGAAWMIAVLGSFVPIGWR